MPASKNIKEIAQKDWNALKNKNKLLLNKISNIHQEKDYFFLNHSKNVSEISKAIIRFCLSTEVDKAIKYENNKREIIKCSEEIGLYHDIGRCCYSNEFLFPEYFLGIDIKEKYHSKRYFGSHAKESKEMLGFFMEYNILKFDTQYLDIISDHHYPVNLLYESWNKFYDELEKLVLFEVLRLADSIDAVISHRFFNNKDKANNDVGESNKDKIRKCIQKIIEKDFIYSGVKYSQFEEDIKNEIEKIVNSLNGKSYAHLGCIFNEERLIGMLPETINDLVNLPLENENKKIKMLLENIDLLCKKLPDKHKIIKCIKDFQKDNLEVMFNYLQKKVK